MLEIGSLLDNKYRILDVVGHGGMSTVYLARNEKANKHWAVKEVLKVGQEDIEIKKNSLVAETEMLKKLDHPNLPTIVDIIETEDTFLVVMDYIEGNDLGEIIDEFGAQPQDKVLEWAKQTCDVLSYLHSRNPVIVYRDLKPANIMLKPDGNITLIDFGTAREAEVKDVANTVSLGTRGYAAPEQFGDGARADARTDIYCFGATIYHLVTGHSPAEEPYVIEPIRKINPSLSAGLEKIILKCTQPNPSDRYQDCDELMYDLEHYREIDDKYRKTQLRKLYGFLSTVIATILCVVISITGYIQHGKQTDAMYASYIDNQDYASAIVLSPNKAQAYLESIEKISKGVIDDKAMANFEVFNSVEDMNNNGNVIYPLAQLASSNLSDYIKVNYKVGCSLWEKYSKKLSRSEKAQFWFKKILPDDYNKLDISKFSDGSSYDINISGRGVRVTIGRDISSSDFKVALVCAKIQDSKQNIKTYDVEYDIDSLSQGDDLKEAYASLWKNMNDIKSLVETVEDKNLSVILVNELTTELSDVQYMKKIISYNGLSQSTVENFSNTLNDSLSSINDGTLSTEREKDISALSNKIIEANYKLSEYFKSNRRS